MFSAFFSRTLQFALQSSATVIFRSLRSSVCRLFVTRVYCDKTAEVRMLGFH